MSSITMLVVKKTFSSLYVVCNIIRKIDNNYREKWHNAYIVKIKNII